MAQIIDYRAPMRSDQDIASRVFTDDFTLTVQPLETDEPSGNEPWQREPQTPAPSAPLALPERAESTSNTVEITADQARWSDAAPWGGQLPGVDDIVIIGPGQTVVMDSFVKVGAILVNGGELIVEDTKNLQLAADRILVNNGGLFQVRTEDNPFVHDFELPREGDDEENDVDVMALLMSTADNVARAVPNDPLSASETTQRVVADVNDEGGWNFRKTTYDADGERIAFEIVFDDGRVIMTAFADVQRTTKI